MILPQFFDPSLGVVRQMFETAGQSALLEANPNQVWIVVISQTLTALIVAPLINGLFTFGEEFGWRAYLQQKLLPLGARRSILLMGIIWGVWHWPMILMGHNYGLEYAGYPWLGMLGMVWFTTLVGVFLAWVTLRSGSVWPAVIGHAALNGVAALPMLFIQGNPHPAVGPFAIGFLGSLSWLIVAVGLFASPRAFEIAQPELSPVELVKTEAEL